MRRWVAWPHGFPVKATASQDRSTRGGLPGRLLDLLPEVVHTNTCILLAWVAGLWSWRQPADEHVRSARRSGRWQVAGGARYVTTCNVRDRNVQRIAHQVGDADVEVRTPTFMAPLPC